jgi:hypothetical protein
MHEIAGRKDPHLLFLDPLMGSGRPAGVSKARPAKKKIVADDARNCRSCNNYRSLISSWIRKACRDF